MDLDKKRNVLLDSLKAIGILLVVLGHNIQILSDTPDDQPLYKLIYSFHMPLFFAISGYVYFLSHKPGKLIGSQLLKKVQHLLIPFFMWHLVQYFLMHKYETVGLGEYAFTLFQTVDYGLWFLLVLFYATAFQLIVSSVTKKPNLQIALSLAIWFFTFLLPNKFGFAHIRLQYPYFAIAFFLPQLTISEKIKNNLINLCYLIFPVAVFFWRRTTPPIFLQNIPLSIYFDKIYRYLTALSGIVICFQSTHYLMQKEKYRILWRALSWLGQKTLAIYAIHFYFLGMIRFLPDGSFNIVGLFLSSLASLICSLLVAQLLLEPNPILSRLFLGQKTNFT